MSNVSKTSEKIYLIKFSSFFGCGYYGLKLVLRRRDLRENLRVIHFDQFLLRYLIRCALYLIIARVRHRRLGCLNLPLLGWDGIVVGDYDVRPIRCQRQRRLECIIPLHGCLLAKRGRIGPEWVLSLVEWIPVVRDVLVVV